MIFWESVGADLLPLVVARTDTFLPSFGSVWPTFGAFRRVLGPLGEVAQKCALQNFAHFHKFWRQNARV